MALTQPGDPPDDGPSPAVAETRPGARTGRGGPGEGGRRRVSPRPIHALLAVFAVLALYYSISTPLLEAPDEPAHIDYMLWLARGNGLPVQSFDHDKVKVVQGHHPPLYYGLGALLTFWIDTSNQSRAYRENRNFVFSLNGTGTDPNFGLHTAVEAFPWTGYVLAARLFRLLSILFGMLTIWGAYRLGQWLTRREAVALGAAALIAFNPQFLYIGGVANNDAAVTAFLTLALVGLVAMLVAGATTRRALAVGACLGLAMLSKATALAWLPLVAFTLGVLWWRQRDWRPIARLVGAIALPFLAISGWWFARNQVLYGDPLGYRMFLSSVSVIYTPADLTKMGTWQHFAEATHSSFWGSFGWLVSTLRDEWLWLFAGFYVLALVGALSGWLWRREAGAGFGVRHLAAWSLLALAVVINVAWVLNFARTNGPSAFQGRYLFPVIAPIAVFLVYGISSVVPERWRLAAVALLLAPVVVVALRAPSAYIAPVFRQLTVPESALAAVQHRIDRPFGPAISLVGYDLEPGDTETAVTLYWRASGTPAEDDDVVIDTRGPAGAACSEQEEPVLGGGFPMTAWRAGDLIADRHVVSVDPACCGPSGCSLRVGFEDAEEGEPGRIQALDGVIVGGRGP